MSTQQTRPAKNSNGFGSLKTLLYNNYDISHSYRLLESKEAEEWGYRGAPVYVHCYSTTNFKGHVEFLSEFDENLAVEVENCGNKWLKYYCQGGGGHLLLKRAFCGHRHFCVRDATAYSRLRVLRAFGVLDSFVKNLRCKTYLIHVVFTLPKSLWQKAVEDPNLFIKTVYDALDEYKGFKGGVLAVHFWHSNNPGKGWYPHIHVLMFNVVAKFYKVFDNGKLVSVKRKREGKVFFVRKRPKINHVFLKMRYLWFLKENFGYDDVKRPDVYVRYVKWCDKNRGKIFHLLKYAFRLPIQDFEKVNFAYLSHEEKLFLWNLLNLRFKRVRWFGFLADGVKRFYLTSVGVNYTTLALFMRNIRLLSTLCPFHGCKMLLLDGG